MKQSFFSPTAVQNIITIKNSVLFFVLMGLLAEAQKFRQA
jgi:hypothetical protein